MKNSYIISIMLVFVVVMILNPTNLFTASIGSITPQDIKFESKTGDAEKFYVLTAYIGARVDGFIITLQKDKQIDLGGNQVVTNGNEIKVQIVPVAPTQTIGVQQGTQLTYACYSYLVSYNECSPEYYKISGNWLTTTKYDITTYKNGQVIYSQQVPVNYQNFQELKIGDIYIENIGQLGNGYNTPTQDFIVVKKPNGEYGMFTESGFAYFLKYVKDNWFAKPLGTITWEQYWNKGAEFGVTPTEQYPTDAVVSYDMLYSKVNQIVLTLPVSISSSTLLIYIPQSLAAGIITLKYASVGTITSVSGCPELDEGKSGNLIVNVKNTGSADYIGVTVTSANHDVYGNTRVYFNALEEKSFTFTLTARGTLQDANVPVTVTADGTSPTNGDSTKALTCKINNVIGLTPTPTPGPTITTTPPGDGKPFEIMLKSWFSSPLMLVLIILAAILILTVKRKKP